VIGVVIGNAKIQMGERIHFKGILGGTNVSREEKMLFLQPAQETNQEYQEHPIQSREYRKPNID
jgi:hypothetical protein